MKTPPRSRIKKGRRLVINSWLEEHTAVPVQFQPTATTSAGIQGMRKWEGWRYFPTRRDRSTCNRLDNGGL
jgi:hypothetical protein